MSRSLGPRVQTDGCRCLLGGTGRTRDSLLGADVQIEEDPSPVGPGRTPKDRGEFGRDPSTSRVWYISKVSPVTVRSEPWDWTKVGPGRHWSSRRTGGGGGPVVRSGGDCYYGGSGSVTPVCTTTVCHPRVCPVSVCLPDDLKDLGGDGRQGRGGYTGEGVVTGEADTPH